ncbi:unnamed protein product [Didymodactylos carnosus]|nr:unnamed protein product [Didymodactylos carnosus]CAF4408856.1 unnamed protein product [Didymodactylos carnosus]
MGEPDDDLDDASSLLNSVEGKVDNPPSNEIQDQDDTTNDIPISLPILPTATVSNNDEDDDEDNREKRMKKRSISTQQV